MSHLSINGILQFADLPLDATKSERLDCEAEYMRARAQRNLNQNDKRCRGLVYSNKKRGSTKEEK